MIQPRVLWWSLGLILVVAGFLRFYRLDGLPPGLYHDEAYNGVDAVRVLAGDRPIYFPANNGREPLFIYLQALSIRFLGQTPLALRLPAALIGWVTVMAMLPLARELWRHHPRRDYLALLSTLFMATLTWHLNFSRTGFRAILLPLFVIGALYFFLQAWRRRGKWAWVWVGIVVGAGFYTYLSAAFIPILVVTLALYGFWRFREQVPDLAKGLVVAALVAVVVFLPLGAYFWMHPGQLVAHSEEVAFLSREYGGANPLLALGSNALKAVGMFFWAGDSNWRHNLADWPMLDPLSAVLFAGGLVLCLRRFCAPQGAVSLLFLGVMLLPTLLSSQGAPHALRGVGVTPAVALLMAEGALGLWDGAKKVVGRFPFGARWGWGAGLALATVISGMAYGKYFLVWGQSPQVYEAFETDIAQSATLLAAQPQIWRDKQVLVAVPWPTQQPIFAYLASAAFPRIRWIEKLESLGAPREPGDALYLFPASVYPEVPQVATYFGPAASLNNQIKVPQTPQGEPALLLFQLAQRAPFPVDSYQPPRAARGGLAAVAEVLGSDYPAQVARGAELTVTILWRPVSTPNPDYALFLHLTDGKGRLWAQRHFGGWPDPRWRFVPDGGERQNAVVGWHRLGLEAAMPPGDYTLSLGVVPQKGGAALPLVDAQGTPSGDRLILGQVRVVKGEARVDVSTLKVERPRLGKLNADLELVGYQMDRPQLKPGEELRVHLYWRALRQPADHLRSLALASPEGQVLSQISGAPVDGRYPTSLWSTGEVVHEMVDLRLRATMPPGEWVLQLALSAGKDAPFPTDKAISLGKVTVLEVLRNFAVPAKLQYPMNAVLGSKTRLRGYDVAAEGWPSVKAGQALGLTLYWQGQQEMDESYTVFLQLLDQDQRLVAQRDALPQEGQHPTTAWLPEEVVADVHQLVLPTGLAPGSYRLIVGMYQAKTMQRLSLPDGGDYVLLGQVTVVP